jgi:hypothetical protein
MNDLNKQIRQYIDAAADPVSIGEVELRSQRSRNSVSNGRTRQLRLGPAIVWAAVVLLLVAVLGLKLATTNTPRDIGPLGHTPKSHVLIPPALSEPRLTDAELHQQQTSLDLVRGSQGYVFALDTGGAYSSTNFRIGALHSVTDADGYLVAELATTDNSSDSYSTQTQYQAIGGFGVSNFSKQTAFYGQSAVPGTASASVSFPVANQGSLVVLVAIGGDAQCETTSGISGLTTDTTWSRGVGYSVLIQHRYVEPGRYTVTENTQQCAPGQDPNHAGDLIGAFVYSPR